MSDTEQTQLRTEVEAALEEAGAEIRTALEAAGEAIRQAIRAAVQRRLDASAPPPSPPAA